MKVTTRYFKLNINNICWSTNVGFKFFGGWSELFRGQNLGLPPVLNKAVDTNPEMKILQNEDDIKI